MSRARPGGGTVALGEVVLRRVGGHAFEGCVEQLATAIRLGVYPLGSMLPAERDLAGRMGVSRATLREAIAALRQAGMVRTQRGRGGGTFVVYEPPAPASVGGALQDQPASRREELLDSLVFRSVVEPGACWVAAQRSAQGDLSTDERAMLTTALQEVDQAPDAAAHRQADSRLHLALAGLSGSPKIAAAVTEAQAALHEMLQRIPVLSANLEHSHRQHRGIVGAVLGGDADKARSLMEEHCDDTAALLRGLLT